MKLIVALALACLALLATSQTVVNEVNACTETEINIDNFAVRNGVFDTTEAVQSVTTTTVNTNPITGAAHNYVFMAKSYPSSVGSPNNILGGFRDTIVYIDEDRLPPPSAGQGVRININTGQTPQGTTRDQLHYSTDQGIKGIGEIQWDGNSDAANPRNFVKTGLGGINLAAGADSFTIELLSTDLPSSFRVEAWSYAGGVAANSQGVFFEWDPSTRQEQVFTFSLFQPISGSVNPVSVFSSLGALRLFIQDNDNTSPEIDLVIFSLGFTSRYCIWKSVAPNPTGLSTTAALFPLFFGSPNAILSGSCTSGALNVGDRVTYFVQSYSEQVNVVNYVLRDTLPAGLTLVPNSVRIVSTVAGVVATLQSSAANTVVVNVNATNANTSRVTVFFDAIIGAGAVDSTTCQSIIPNSATLDFGGSAPLTSSFYNGTGVTAHTADICVRGTASFSLAVQASKTQVDTDESFTLTTTYSNTGTIGAANTTLYCTVTTSNAVVTTSGWTRNGYTWSRNIGTVAPGSNSASLSFTPSADTDISIHCCIDNTANSSPAFCESMVCRDISIQVGSTSNLKLCKRGHLIRRLFYDVDYFNCGDGDANDVVITENVPAGTTFNADLSDSRWSCVNGVCTIRIDVLAAGTVECAKFVVDINDNTPVCTEFNNTAVIAVLDATTPDVVTTDNTDSVSLIQEGCPLPPPPTPPACCDCPAPPSPPPMCPCPQPDPCDECYEDDDSDECTDDGEDHHHGGYGKGSKSTTTINFDFSGEDLV